MKFAAWIEKARWFPGKAKAKNLITRKSGDGHREKKKEDEKKSARYHDLR